MADPVSLALLGGAAAGLFGGGASALGSALGPKPQAPSVLPPAAPPVQSPPGSQTSNAPQQTPSFLAAAAMPQGNQAAGAKSLLGQ